MQLFILALVISGALMWASLFPVRDSDATLLTALVVAVSCFILLYLKPEFFFP